MPGLPGRSGALISAPAAHFKGSGFYSTDYAAKPAPSGNSKDGGQAATSDGSSKVQTKVELIKDLVIRDLPRRQKAPRPPPRLRPLRSRNKFPSILILIARSDTTSVKEGDGFSRAVNGTVIPGFSH